MGFPVPVPIPIYCPSVLGKNCKTNIFFPTDVWNCTTVACGCYSESQEHIEFRVPEDSVVKPSGVSQLYTFLLYSYI